MMKKLINYALIFCSGIFFLLGFWFKFLREKLPRSIPFDFTLLSFLGVALICVTYLLAIYFFLSKTSIKQNLLLEYIKKPFDYFDTNIKNNITIKPYFQKAIILLKAFVMVYYKQIIITEYLIRFFIISIFLIDIFIFNKIFYTYKIVYFVVILLSIKYIIFSLNKVKNEQIVLLHEKVEIHLNSFTGPILDINIFIHEQTMQRIYNKPEHIIDLWLRQDYLEKRSIELNLKPHITLNIKAIYNLQEKVLNLILNLNHTIYIYELQKKKYAFLHLILMVLYLVCWNYILFKSFHTLENVLLLDTLQDVFEPFSGIKLEHL